MSAEKKQLKSESIEKLAMETNSHISEESMLAEKDSNSKSLTPAEKKERRADTLKRVKAFIKLFFSWNVISMSLAHHPECETFDKHVFKIGKKLRICRGCTLSYPPLYGLVLVFIFWPAAREFFLAKGFLIANLWWFTIGFLLLGVSGLLLRKYSLFINDIYKFSRGAFSGLLAIIVLSQHWGFKIGAGIAFMAGMAYLSIHRGKDMERTCEECEWNANYDECPGWRDITQAFSEIQSTSTTQPVVLTSEKPKPQMNPIENKTTISPKQEDDTN